MRLRKLVLLAILVTAFIFPATALDLNSSYALRYYPDTNLEFQVGTDGTISTYGDLDMGSGVTNNISNFFQDNCANDEAVTRVFQNGTYDCEAINDLGGGTEDLSSTLDAGWSAGSNNISLNGNNITDVDEIKNFFQEGESGSGGQCGSGEAVQYVQSDGTYHCIDISAASGADDQNLEQVLVQGNVANMSIDMGGNPITNIDSLFMNNPITDSNVSDSITVGNSGNVSKSAIDTTGSLGFDWQDTEVANDITIGSSGGTVEIGALDDSTDDLGFDWADDEVSDGITLDSSSTIYLPNTGGTTEGRIQWENTNDRIIVGTGGGTVTFYSGPHTDEQNLSEVLVHGAVANQSINMNGFEVQNVISNSDGDAINRSYMQDYVNTNDDSGTDDQNLQEVLVQGDTANRSINMGGNNIHNINTLSVSTALSDGNISNTLTITGGSVDKGVLNNQGSLGFEWIDSEVAGDISINSSGSVDSTALTDGGTIGFDWVDDEVADSLTVGSGGSVQDAFVSLSSHPLDTGNISDSAITSAKIGNGEIVEEDLSVTNGPTDNYYLTYDSGGGFEWVSDTSTQDETNEDQALNASSGGGLHQISIDDGSGDVINTVSLADDDVPEQGDFGNALELTGEGAIATFDNASDLDAAGDIVTDAVTSNELDSDGSFDMGSLTVSNDATIQGDLFVVGNISNTNVQELNVNGSILPPREFDGQFDLGSGSQQWRDLYLSRNIEIGSISLSESDLDALNDGVIDKGELDSAGSLGFEWQDGEVSDGITVGSSGRVDGAFVTVGTALSAGNVSLGNGLQDSSGSIAVQADTGISVSGSGVAVDWSDASELTGQGAIATFDNASDLDAAGAVLWSNANDLDSSGNVNWESAAALTGDGGISSFNNASDLDAGGSLVNGAVGANQIVNGAVNGTHIGVSCSNDEVLQYSDGVWVCGSKASNTDDQSLQEVLVQGNVANDTIDMDTNDITNIGSSRTNITTNGDIEAGGDIRMEGSNPKIDLGNGMYMQRKGNDVIISDS